MRGEKTNSLHDFLFIIYHQGWGRFSIFLPHPAMGCFLIFFPENLPLRHSEPCNQTSPPTTHDLPYPIHQSFTSKGFLCSNAFPCWAVPMCTVYSATLFSQGESDEHPYLHWGDVGV